MTARLSDAYFDRLYAQSADPWQLGERWYEQRKHALTLACLPRPRYRHAFEPGCSVGVLSELLARRCDRVTSTDVAEPALEATRRRLTDVDLHAGVTLLRRSIDDPWPSATFDLVVISEVAYYLQPRTLRAVLDREVPRLPIGATVVAAHWRHAVEDYPLTGDAANAIIGETAGLYRLGGYQDADVAIDVFDTESARSVAAHTGVPGAT